MSRLPCTSAPGVDMEVPSPWPPLPTEALGARDTGHAGIPNLHAPLPGSSDPER